jgi:HTH-type transcriptional regulator / antitoxin HigA
MCAPEAIKFRLDQLDKTGKVREALLGGRGQVSEILTKKRSLSLEMIRCRLRELQIPLESLVSSAAE